MGRRNLGVDLAAGAYALRAILIGLWSLPLWAQQVHRVEAVSEPVLPYVIDVDLRDLPVAPDWRPGDPIKEVPKLSDGPLPPDYVEPRNRRDPLLHRQSKALPGGDIAFTTPVFNFQGQGFTGVQPPDPVGDVGILYFIQGLNTAGGTRYMVYDKSDGAIVAGPFMLENLASGGPCTSGFGDPMIQFDRLANRWLLAEFPPPGNNNLCVYISQTEDPIAGGWFAYTFNTINFPDYPKYGVWPDAYYVTTNEATSRIWTLDRQRMLIGAPATSQVFSLVDLPGFVFQSTTPADVTGRVPPPLASPGIILRHRDDEVHNPGNNDPNRDFIEMFEVTVDFDAPGNSALVGPIDIPVAEFDSTLCGLATFNCFPQPGSSVTLDPIKQIIMHRLQYRNFGTHEALIGNFVTDADGNNTGGLRWFELRRSSQQENWSVFQEGTFAPDTVNRWLGSCSVDGSGNIAIAYSVTDAVSVFPGLRYAGRLHDDPQGTLPQGEVVIVNGSGANVSNRFGDYASLSVDPVDDCTFWFTGQYNTASSWTTRIAAFRFDSCECVPPAPPSGLTAIANGDNRIELDWPTVPGAGSYSIYRSIGNCPAGDPELLAVGVAATFYADKTPSGGTTYAYQVRAVDLAESCASEPSQCAAALASGECLLPPSFDGLQAVIDPQTQACRLELFWNAASTSCDGGLRYNVYRSETTGFTPSLENLIASCLDTLSYTDEDIVAGSTYFYIVRAEDQTGLGGGPCAGGHEDDNHRELSGSAGGPDVVLGEDDLENGASNWAVQALPADSGTMPWRLVAAETINWFCGGEAGVKDQTLQLTDAVMVPPYARLQFRHRVATRNFLAGGVLEYSLDGGTNWADILHGEGDFPANGGRFLVNGYTGGLLASGNPLGTRSAWFGNSSGYREVIVDLADFAGRRVHFRWRLGCDRLGSGEGWWIDDVTLVAAGQCVGVCDNFFSFLPYWPDRSILYLLTCPMPDN